MTEQEKKHKKTPVTTYSFGEKNYLMVAEFSTGYHLWGEIGGKHIDAQGKDLDKIYPEVVKQLDNAHKDYTLKAMECEAFALRMKTSKARQKLLEKIAKDLGGTINERE